MFGAILGAAGGIAKGIMGAVQAGKARKAIANYKRQSLGAEANAYKDMAVSTLGADLAREELGRASATSIDALKSGGVRGVVGGVGSVLENVNTQARQIGADLDTQKKDIDLRQAEDKVRLRQLKEEREKADLAGLGQQLAVGQQNLFSGISDVAQAGSSIAAGVKENKGSGEGVWGALGF